MLLRICHILQYDVVGTSEERVGDLNLERLRVIAADGLSLTFGTGRVGICVVLGSLLLAVLLILFEDLVTGLLKFIVTIIENLAELERHFGIAFTRVGVKNLWELSLANDSVLNLTDSFIAENDMSFVDTELKWQEQDLNCSILVALLDLQLLLLDVEWFGNRQG